jgi:hypothetical protein
VATFTRLAAVSVGLANLAVLAGLFDGDSPLRRGEVTVSEALPPVLAAVVAGLLTSEIVLRTFKLQRQRFFERYGLTVLAVCLGGVLMGGLLAGLFALNGVLFPRPSTILEGIGAALISGLVGAAFGLGLGLAEGLVLAFPIAAILGLFMSRR